MSDAPDLIDLIRGGELDPELIERLAATDPEVLRARLSEYLDEDLVAGIMSRLQELIDAKRHAD